MEAPISPDKPLTKLLLSFHGEWFLTQRLKTEGRKGQKESWAQATAENALKMKTEVLVHLLNLKAAFADVWLILSLNWWQMICRRGRNTFKSSNVHLSVFLSQLSPDVIIANLQSSSLMPGWGSVNGNPNGQHPKKWKNWAQHESS